MYIFDDTMDKSISLHNLTLHNILYLSHSFPLAQ